MSAMAPNSPRLPSPPPPAEIPAGIPMDRGAHNEQLAEAALYQINSKRRVHPGTRSKDMASGPPLVNLSELDSPFQLQEHLAALHYYHTESSIKPVTRSVAAILAQPPPSVDRIVWLYELCRFLISQCNSLIVGFLFDTPPCSAATCPEMRASEWQFLCAVHETPKSCCAIDYCCHTLDWAANVITDPKLFPSRFITMSESHMTTPGMKTLINVFRRLHRIFAHAWFLHRNVFWAVEDPSGLYILFKTVCNIYNLLPGDAYELPPEAEGLISQQAPAAEHTSDRKVSGPITIIKQVSTSKSTSAPTPSEESERPSSRASNHDNNTAHSGTASVGSVVGTVPEHEEDNNTSSQHSEEVDDNVSVAHGAGVVSPSEDSSKSSSPTAGAGAKDKDISRRKSPSRAKPSQVPVPVESSKPFSDDITIISNDYTPARAKTASPRPGSGSGSINLPPSKLPKKASPRPPKAMLRTASPAGTTPPSAIPPPMHTASGGTVIAPASMTTSTPEPPVDTSTTMATGESNDSMDENTSKAIELPESRQTETEDVLTEESEESEESDVDALSKEESMRKDEQEEDKQEHADEIPEVKAESEEEDKADKKTDEEEEKSEEKESTTGLKIEDKSDEKTKKKKRRKSKAKGKGDNKATTSEA